MALILKDRVRDTSTTAGTGSFTLSGSPPSAYQAFSAVCGNGDTIYYTIANRAASEWEVGVGTSDGGTTLARTTVLASSNGGATVNFSAGTKDVFGTMPAERMAYNPRTTTEVRELLTDDRTYYVRTDGDDDNDGLTNSAGGAFLTWQAAYDFIANSIDFGGHVVTVQCGGSGSRTFNGLPTDFGNIVLYVNKGWVGGGQLVFLGNPATPSEVIFDTTSFCILTDSNLGGRLFVAGFDLKASTGYGVLHNAFGQMIIGTTDFGGAMRVGDCLHGHFVTAGGGSTMEIDAAVTIYGDSEYHLQATNGSLLAAYNSVTLTGTPAFDEFASALSLSFLESFQSFSGSATGARYEVELNAVINTGGAGANYFPGDAPGNDDGYGVYA